MTRYTYDMRKIAIAAAFVLLAYLAMMPAIARAKPMGDTIGAPTKDAVDMRYTKDELPALLPAAPVLPIDTGTVLATSSATTTPATTLTTSEQIALLQELLAQLIELRALLLALQH